MKGFEINVRLRYEGAFRTQCLVIYDLFPRGEVMAKWVEFEIVGKDESVDLILINMDHVIHVMAEPKKIDLTRLAFECSTESLKYITVKGNYATTREKLR